MSALLKYKANLFALKIHTSYHGALIICKTKDLGIPIYIFLWLIAQVMIYKQSYLNFLIKFGNEM